MLRASIALILSVAFADAASAAKYIFTVKGFVGPLISSDISYASIPNPAATISPGDAVSVSFVFDADNRTPYPFFNYPTIARYGFGINDFKVSIGSFDYHQVSGSYDAGYFTIWNNYDYNGPGRADGLFIDAVHDMNSQDSPISLGSGAGYLGFYFNGYDFSALSRSSTSIEEQPSLEMYGSKSANITFGNSSNFTRTGFSIDGLQATIDPVPAIPEPNTWTMVIIGMGIIGGMLRGKNILGLSSAPA